MREMSSANERTWRDWERTMTGQRFSKDTVSKYRRVIERLDQFADGDDVLSLAPGDMQRWMLTLVPLAPASALTYFSTARRMYNWAIETDLIDEPSPMAKIKAPNVAEKPAAIPETDNLRAVIAVCQAESKGRRRPGETERAARSRRFYALRDEAMIRLLAEPGGPRASEIAKLPVDGVDLAHDTITVTGKGTGGGKVRTFPMSATTASVMSRYLRARATHSRAASPRFFLGKSGEMTRTGPRIMLSRRCDQAGVPHIPPHGVRRLATHRFLKAGGSEINAMELFGWNNLKMVRHYAGALTSERAVESARQMALGDAL